jgi:GH25 family lysozyme M1 (1,4-beta-N-acetylmuramidase)
MTAKASRKPLFAAVALVACAVPGASQAQNDPPTDAKGWPLGLNSQIAPDLAARIVLDDHPMGSQIRLHEGNRAQMTLGAKAIAAATGSVAGMDVSGWQGNVNWSGAWNNGARFAYVKATEGTGYTNPYFAQQYNGSYNVGMIRGSYHFARPDISSGAYQADYFVNHGGGWSGDGKTLPGALDMEYNPYGSTCYGLSQAGMAAWIASFSNEYHARTERWPVIYTSTSWWSQCVGSAGNFSNTSPLWVANYSSSAGILPYAWGYYTFWQYADSGTFPGDQNVFNGAYDRLQALANG